MKNMNELDSGYSWLALIALLVAVPAEAYIGPGLGAGTLGVILGLLGSVLIAIFAFFWYPIKRAFRRWRASDDELIEDEDALEDAKEEK